MSSLREALTRVTGISKADIDAVFEEVKANQARLAACARHDFSIPIDRHLRKALPKPAPFCRWQCSRCQGVVDGQGKRWYELGLVHGAAASPPGQPF